LNSGHYTATIRQGQKWLKYNDSVVTEVSESKIKSAEVYILIYKISENNKKFKNEYLSLLNKIVFSDSTSTGELIDNKIKLNFAIKNVSTGIIDSRKELETEVKFAKKNYNKDCQKDEETKIQLSSTQVKSQKLISIPIKLESENSNKNKMNFKTEEAKISSNTLTINVGNSRKKHLLNSFEEEEVEVEEKKAAAITNENKNKKRKENNLQSPHGISFTNFDTINNSVNNKNENLNNLQRENTMHDVFYFEEPVCTPYGEGFFIESYEIENTLFAKIKFFSIGFGFVK